MSFHKPLGIIPTNNWAWNGTLTFNGTSLAFTFTKDTYIYCLKSFTIYVYYSEYDLPLYDKYIYKLNKNMPWVSQNWQVVDSEQCCFFVQKLIGTDLISKLSDSILYWYAF